MGVSKTITVTCDFKGCTSVLSWNETEVGAGRQQPPEEALYLVLITHNNVQKAFCCQLHAAEYFLPPGYETKQKQVIELPKPKEEPTDLWARLPKTTTWMDDPPRSEDAVEQADGSPDNGQGGSLC
jgi:hypothetical protein